MSDAKKLLAKLKDWQEYFDHRDVNSIKFQLGQLLWRSAFYRSINESRKYLAEDGRGNKMGNGPLHELINDGYFVMNALAIRRLLDDESSSGSRGVYSLYGLVRDLKKNLSLITRENVLEVRGLPYDFEPIKALAIETANEDARKKGGAAYSIPVNGWFDSEYWHKAMDKLAGVSAAHRTKKDVPAQRELDLLEKRLEKCGRSIKDWTNKFVAHSASIQSRKVLPPRHQSMNLTKLRDAERTIVQISSFVSCYFVDGSQLGGVPIPQFDQFENLDQPFVDERALKPMRDIWDQWANQAQSWTNWDGRRR